MIQFPFRFTYGKLDGLRTSRCDKCNAGGLWKGKIGAPELRGKKFHDWNPDKEDGCTWDGEDPKDPVEHVIVIHPELHSHPVRKTDVTLHEIFHVIDHTERCRDTPRWHLPHAVITRLATALAKFLHENRLQIVPIDKP